MNKTYMILAAAVSLLPACSDQYAVAPAEFGVEAPQTVKVGERVRFGLSGKLDMITFYSGEEGKAYEYKDVDRIGNGNMEFSFSLSTSSGTAGYPNPSTLPISYSTDFNGNYTKEDMDAATWVDISSQYSYPTDVGQTVPAGSLNINKYFVDKDHPIYFRFHYLVEAYNASKGGGLGNGRTQWQVSNSTVKCVSESSEVTVYDIFAQQWHIIPGLNYESIPVANRPDLPGTSARILFRSEFKPNTDRECWTISGPIHMSGDVNLGRDKGIAIKAISDPQMDSYSYQYDKPGVYTATFVGINANMNGRQECVRQVKVNVVQDSGNIHGPEQGEWK